MADTRVLDGGELLSLVQQREDCRVSTLSSSPMAATDVTAQPLGTSMPTRILLGRISYME